MDKKRGKIKAVIFDIGGVLALTSFIKRKNKLENSVHALFAKKLRISLDKWFDSIDTAYALAMAGQISEKKTMDIFSSNLNVKKSLLKKIIISSYRESFSQNTELYNFAFSLKKRGYKIAILSDQWWLSKKALIVPRYMRKFDVSVISCDVGIRKPNPNIFRLVLKRLRVRPYESIFIDNMKFNTKPAKKLGMHAILFKNNEQLFKEMTSSAH